MLENYFLGYFAGMNLCTHEAECFKQTLKEYNCFDEEQYEIGFTSGFNALMCIHTYVDDANATEQFEVKESYDVFYPIIGHYYMDVSDMGRAYEDILSTL